MFKRIFIIFSFLLASNYELPAQVKEKIEFELKAGVNDFIYGDISGSNYNRFDDPAAAFGIHYWFDNKNALGLEYNWSRMSIWNAQPAPFTIDVREDLNAVGVIYKYRVFETSGYSFTLSGGAAYLFYNAKVQATPDPLYKVPGNYSEKDFALPVGLAFSYRYNDLLSFNTQAMVYTTFSDRMDAFTFYNVNFGDEYEGYLNLTAGFSVFLDADQDKDGDGISNSKDKCPLDAEDKDGFQDKDGCPDPDNDKDGMDDLADKCPNKAEDFDGFEDDDGCPDLDNDKDNIADNLDRCPNKPEDSDGFQDDDGCPDYDNDKDFITDEFDKCPNQREDYDGFEDNDGCPEFDNDRDGITDINDACPNDAEVINGIADDDGCPEFVLKKNDRIMVKELLFLADKIELTAESAADLLKLKPLFNANPKLVLQIAGYTDNSNGAIKSKAVSLNRANCVRDFLINKLGVAKERLNAVGLGSEKPLADNKTPEGRAKNNRIELKVLKNE